MINHTLRCSKKQPCPICSKPGFCYFLSDDHLTVCCMQESEGRAATTKDSGSVFRYCSICTRWGACGVSRDGQVAFCVNNQSQKQTKKGAFVHPLDGEGPRAAPKTAVRALPASKQATLAPIERRDVVYKSFLSSLSLSGFHARQLVDDRQMSDVGVAREEYATTPSPEEITRLTREIAQRFDLSGVPGFYQENSTSCLVSLPPSLLIPVRDVQGRIQAIRVRLDNAEKDKRYLWLSSAWKPGGVSPGSPMHWARPWRIESTRKLIITEGELKAQVTAEMLDEAVLSLPGVTSFSADIGIDLKRLFPTLERVAIAFDADFATNPHVLNSLLRLGNTLRAAKLAVSVLKWPTIAGVRVKGIDDFLVARAQ